MSLSDALLSKFQRSKKRLAKKLEVTKKRVDAAKKAHSKHFLFESLMQTAKDGRLRAPEGHGASKCKDCGGETLVVERREDTSVVFGGMTFENIYYGVCFACCAARELRGHRIDSDGWHWA